MLYNRSYQPTAQEQENYRINTYIQNIARGYEAEIIAQAELTGECPKKTLLGKLIFGHPVREEFIRKTRYACEDRAYKEYMEAKAKANKRPYSALYLKLDHPMY